MARQACAASGGMLAASVADTRVDLVSSSSIDVSVVILAVSIVQDRSKVSVRPSTLAFTALAFRNYVDTVLQIKALYAIDIL